MTTQTVKRVDWPSAGPEAHYRITVRDQTSGTTLGVLRNLNAPVCEIPIAWIQQAEQPCLRVEWCEGGRGWSTWIPFHRIDTPTRVHQWLRAPEHTAGMPLRLVVRSGQDGGTLLDEARRGDFPLSPGLAPAGARLKYKFMRFDPLAGRWIDTGPYRTMIYGPASGASHTPAQRPSIARPRLYFFTVDVEVNMRYQEEPCPGRVVDEQIFGVTGEGAYGIGHIMDELDHVGFKGTFFVDVLMYYQVGEEETRRVIDAILERGHGVQLHLHPNPNLYYSKSEVERQIAYDYKRTRSSLAFRQSLEIAMALFERFTGKPAVAFRNGAYIIRNEYFPVLAEFGLRYDSSCYAWKNFEAAPWLRARTTPFKHPSGVIEIPVNWYMADTATGRRPAQYTLAQSRGRAARRAAAIESHWRYIGSPLVTLIHSYTLLKEHRRHDMESVRRWNLAAERLVARDAYDLMHLSEPERLVLDGADHARIEDLHALLTYLAEHCNVLGVAIDETLSDDDILFEGDTALDYAPSANDAGDGTLLPLRKYSRSFLKARLVTDR